MVASLLHKQLRNQPPEKNAPKKNPRSRRRRHNGRARSRRQKAAGRGVRLSKEVRLGRTRQAGTTCNARSEDALESSRLLGQLFALGTRARRVERSRHEALHVDVLAIVDVARAALGLRVISGQVSVLVEGGAAARRADVRGLLARLGRDRDDRVASVAPGDFGAGDAVWFFWLWLFLRGFEVRRGT